MSVSWILTPQDLAKQINKPVKQKWDYTVAITGEEGVGKSALALLLSLAGDPNFDVFKNELYAPDFLRTKALITDLPPNSWIVADEAIRILYKLRRDRVQIFLNMLYAVARSQRKISLMLMPRFRDFNEYFRNHRIRLWIHVISRGIAIVHKRLGSEFTYDPWFYDYGEKAYINLVRRKKVVNVKAEDIIDFERRMPTFIGIVAFENPEKMTPEQWKKYNVDVEEYTKKLKEEKPEVVKDIVREVYFGKPLPKYITPWDAYLYLKKQNAFEGFEDYEREELLQVLPLFTLYTLGFKKKTLNELFAVNTSHLLKNSFELIKQSVSKDWFAKLYSSVSREVLPFLFKQKLVAFDLDLMKMLVRKIKPRDLRIQYARKIIELQEREKSIGNIIYPVEEEEEEEKSEELDKPKPDEEGVYDE